MASLDDYDLRAGETDVDRRKRIKLHIRERDRKKAEAREARRKERQAGRKPKEGGSGGTGGKPSGPKSKNK